MLRVADQNQGIVAQGHSFHFRMVQRTRDANFYFAVEDHLQHLRRSSGSQAHHDFWIRCLIILHYIRQKISAHRKSRRNAQRSTRRWLQFVYCLPGFGYVTQELFSMRTQGFAGWGNYESGAGSREQFHAERIFERPDARAYGRLADAQRGGGAVKSAVRANRQKRLDLVNFHAVLANLGGSNRRKVIRVLASP